VVLLNLIYSELWYGNIEISIADILENL
jgi:hypothetical protein